MIKISDSILGSTSSSYPQSVSLFMSKLFIFQAYVSEMAEKYVSIKEENSPKFSCNICRRKFSLKNELSIHIRGAHFGMLNFFADCSNEKPINIDETDQIHVDNNLNSLASAAINFQPVCRICNDMFESNIKLNDHMKAKHLSQINTNCDVHSIKNDSSILMAKKNVLNKPEYNIDTLRNDCSTDSKIAIDPTKILNDINLTNHNRVVCNICVDEFESKSILTKHIKSVHFGVNSYTCAMCSESFQSRELVIKHYNVCEGGLSIQSSNSTEQMGQDDNLRKKETHEEIYSNQQKNLQTHIHYDCLKSEPVQMLNQKNAYDSKGKKALRLRKKKSINRKLNIRKISKKRTMACYKKEKQKLLLTKCKVSKKVCHKKDLDKHRSSVKKCMQKSDNKVNDSSLSLSFRICFICQDGTLDSFSSYISHMLCKHSLPQQILDQELDLLHYHSSVNDLLVYKCLRCGTEMVLRSDEIKSIEQIKDQLLKIQIHLQFDCVRAPFNLDNIMLTKFYCTICGKVFEDTQSHDIHVASVHYPHFFVNKKTHESIPWPHILYFSIPMNKLIHKNGPYVCPYNHSTPNSESSIGSLLEHAKHCDKRFGILALQCNVCFKMLLCDNSFEQLNKLKKVVMMDYLQCCDITEKSFKCYCCGHDFSWSLITNQLKLSIDMVHSVRSKVIDGKYSHQDYKDLKKHPTIHTSKSDNLLKKHKPYRMKLQQLAGKNIDMIKATQTKTLTLCKDNTQTMNSVQDTINNKTVKINNLHENAAHKFLKMIPVNQIKTHVAATVKQAVSNGAFDNVNIQPAPELHAASKTSKSFSDIYKLRCYHCNTYKSKLKTFNCKELYIQHMMNHESEKSTKKLCSPVHYCFDCGKQFYNKTNWRIHVKNQHPFCVLLKCEIKDCGMEFQRPSDMQEHIFKVHRNTTFECNFCFDKFYSEMNLLCHLKNVHNS